MGGMLLAAMGGGHAIAATPSLPVKVVTHQLGTANGFGFGRDVCPLGCQLPGPPTGNGDAPPFDQPDAPPPNCALSVSWTHDFRAVLPDGAQILSGVLVLNMAGIQAELFSSVLTAGAPTVFPLYTFDQGAMGSGPVPVPLKPGDLAGGVLQVTITKGGTIRGVTRCDDQYYDTSVLVLLVQLP
jgi:hypothetical protein